MLARNNPPVGRYVMPSTLPGDVDGGDDRQAVGRSAGAPSCERVGYKPRATSVERRKFLPTVAASERCSVNSSTVSARVMYPEPGSCQSTLPPDALTNCAPEGGVRSCGRIAYLT